MAIKIEFDSKFGDSYLEAYARVINIDVDYVDQIAKVKMGIYKDESARNKKLQPLQIEEYRYSGEEFQKLFAEILADKEDASISPIRNIYEDLVKKEGDKYDKYSDGEKVFDTDFDTGKEIGREEILQKAQDAVKAAKEALEQAQVAVQVAEKSEESTPSQIASLIATRDAAVALLNDLKQALDKLLDSLESEDDRRKLK